MLKLISRTAPVLVVFLFLLAGAREANAQGVSVYFGLGSATDGQLPGDPNCATYGPHFIINDTGGCDNAPTIGGVFGVFGGDVMFRPHFGINAEYTFRFTQAPFFESEGLNFRPSFFDFNAVYQPTASDSKFVPVIEGGIGAAHFPFYIAQGTFGGSTYSYPAYVSSNHFLVHGAVGVKIYVKGDIFIKPQFDIRYVHNLNQQFSRSLVPEYTVSVGYTFGR